MSNYFNFFQEGIAPDAPQIQDPFFTTKNMSESELLDWLKTEIQAREKLNAPFFSECYKNLRAYANGYYKKVGRQTDSNNDLPSRRTSQYCVNYLYETTENLVSRMTRIKPAVEVIPSNDEFEDKNSAKAVKLLTQHLGYINDIDFLLQKTHRQKIIMGEAYPLIDWDKDKGDLHPDYVRLRNAGKLKDDGSLPRELLDVPVKTGDVCLGNLLPYNLLLENREDYDLVENAFTKEIKSIAELKDEFPELAKKIGRAEGGERAFNPDSMQEERLGKQCILYTFYQKASKHFPKGRMIKLIHNLILEQKDLPFSHGGFPWERITDIDIPGQLRGRSRYSQALPLQNSHNNLSTVVMKNEFLMGAPKWVMPKNACKFEQLANGRTIVQYQGATPPQLVQMNPTSPTTFAFRDSIKAEIGEIMQSGPLLRGEPPKGIVSGVALQFLNEQENERSISDISKHNNLVRNIYRKAIAVAGDKYDPTDGRMLRVLGKENRHLLKYFDSANLHKDYDIRIANSSALPESKAARMERILQTVQYAPTLFTPERWVELLEFGNTEKMHTLATEAIHSAESIVQDILEGNDVADPEEWEDLITHLRVLYKALQKRSFKEEVPLDRREMLKLYTKTVERLSANKARSNPLFAAKLAQLEMFPVFWKSAEVPPSREQQERLVEGQSNRGEQVTASIPAQEPEEIPTEQTLKGR